MNRYYTSRPSSFMYMLGGVAIGMLAMYLLDPEQGNRRRAVIRDKAYSAARSARKRADARSRHLANRARGMAAKLRHTVHEATGLPAEVVSTQSPDRPE